MNLENIDGVREDTNDEPQTNPEVVPEVKTQEDEAMDSLFGTDNLFGVFDEETKPEPEKPEAPVKPESSDKQKELDDQSFKYWQSVADRKENKIRELEARLSNPAPSGGQPESRALPERNPATGQFVGNEQSNQPAQEIVFPDPPPRPKKPNNFSRSDALADDNSESSRYLDDMDSWRGDITEYNSLRLQYSDLQRENTMRAEKEERDRGTRQKQAYNANQRKLGRVVDTLKRGYQATDEQIRGFVGEMSKKESVSIDNLWKVYAFNNGIPIVTGANAAPIGTQKNNMPSEEFQQIERTQNVPNPMGTFPSDRSQGQKSEIDVAIDKMVQMEKDENPLLG